MFVDGKYIHDDVLGRSDLTHPSSKDDGVPSDLQFERQPPNILILTKTEFSELLSPKYNPKRSTAAEKSL